MPDSICDPEAPGCWAGWTPWGLFSEISHGCSPVCWRQTLNGDPQASLYLCISQRASQKGPCLLLCLFKFTFISTCIIDNILSSKFKTYKMIYNEKFYPTHVLATIFFYGSQSVLSFSCISFQKHFTRIQRNMYLFFPLFTQVVFRTYCFMTVWYHTTGGSKLWPTSQIWPIASVYK